MAVRAGQRNLGVCPGHPSSTHALRLVSSQEDGEQQDSPVLHHRHLLSSPPRGICFPRPGRKPPSGPSVEGASYGKRWGHLWGSALPPSGGFEPLSPAGQACMWDWAFPAPSSYTPIGPYAVTRGSRLRLLFPLSRGVESGRWLRHRRLSPVINHTTCGACGLRHQDLFRIEPRVVRCC